MRQHIPLRTTGTTDKENKMDKGLFIRINRNGKFADGIYTRGLPYPLGVVDIPAIVNEKRTCYASIPHGVFLHLGPEDARYLRDAVLDGREGRSVVLVDSHDAATWTFDFEKANW